MTNSLNKITECIANFSECVADFGEKLQSISGSMHTVLECEDCKRAKSDVVVTTCPFDSDVHNKNTPAVLCDECYDKRCMKI